MDFFEQQDRARRKTSLLVVLFFAAVLGIIAMVYIIVLVAAAGIGAKNDTIAVDQIIYNPMLLVGVAVAVIAVVGGGSLYKFSQLRGGGRTIAEMLDGRLLDASTRDPIERKILNVVEEMAIASGVPVPPVYMMDREGGINAFAAGYSPSDAVIGVTRGCAELLDRDELQGVMAHEFSHILNGDMRINIRLIGIIFGILVIGFIGQIIMRSAFYSNATRSRRSSDKNNGGMYLFLVGLALLIVGSLGVFFGNLIKAAVSRQREYLADASAVQFTRYPQGISGALQKIGGYTFKAKLNHPKADEASHMFFGEGVTHWLGSSMATHPPLADRIKRIDPSWNGEFEPVETPKFVKERAEKKAKHLSRDPQLDKRMQMARDLMVAAPLIGQIGSPTPQHVAHASKLLQELSVPVKTAAREPFGARAVVYAMLLDRDQTMRDTQMQALQASADTQVFALTQKLTEPMFALDPAVRLPVIDLAMPALRSLSPSQYQAFRDNVNVLIKADKKVELFEWVLRKILLRHLESHFGEVHRPVVQYYNLRGVKDACATLLSVLAYAGHTDKESALAAFKLGARTMQLEDIAPKPPADCSLDHLDNVLNELNSLAPRAKQPVIQGAAACIASDHEVTIAEVELLRAICDTLDCPMPPLLPGQALV